MQRTFGPTISGVSTVVTDSSPAANPFSAEVPDVVQYTMVRERRREPR